MPQSKKMQHGKLKIELPFDEAVAAALQTKAPTAQKRKKPKNDKRRS